MISDGRFGCMNASAVEILPCKRATHSKSVWFHIRDPTDRSTRPFEQPIMLKKTNGLAAIGNCGSEARRVGIFNLAKAEIHVHLAVCML